MSTNITYNGKSLPYPLPTISREDTPIVYGEKWGKKYEYSLEGFLINCSGYDQLIDQQQALLNIFNKDFQSLSISDTDINIVHPVCIIEDINFGDSDYLYNVPYTISLSTYDSGSFIQNGILNPQDSWDFSTEEDKIVNLSHVVSAKGFNTSSSNTNSLRNAINFVQQRTGLNNKPSLQFVTGAGDFILKSQLESLNRLEGIYSISETYEQDQLSAGFLKRYTIDINSGLQGFINVGINGTIEGGINADLNTLRNDYHAFNIYSIVYGFYTGATNNYDLNILPLSSGVVEDPFKKIISFSINYDNNPNPLVNIDYSVDIQEGENATLINVDGNIIGRGEMSKRWTDIRSYYYTELDMYSLAKSGYLWNGGAYSVNPVILSSGVVFDSYRGAIAFKGTFDDREQPPANFKEFDYTIEIKPPIRQVVSTPMFTNPEGTFNNNGEYYLTDLGFYNKVQMTINGVAVLAKPISTDSSIELVNNEITNIFFKYANDGSIMTNKNISFLPPFGQQISFNYSWIFDGSNVNNTENYPLVLNLNYKT